MWAYLTGEPRPAIVSNAIYAAGAEPSLRAVETVQPIEPDAQSALPLRQYLIAEPWILEALQFEETSHEVSVEIGGFALPDPQLGPSSAGRFLINGEPFAEIEYPIFREDILTRVCRRASSGYSGFRCRSSGPRESIFRDGVMELTHEGPGPQPRIPAHRSCFVLDPKLEDPAPDETRRFRVLGNAVLIDFLRSGFTDFKRLDAAAEGLSGKGFSGYPRILDWGCGCGRLARYAARLPGVAVSGCDVDHDNLDWCAQNLPGTFVKTGMHPPLPFPDESFDLIYGLSVFTHLREPLQNEWLAELNRVSAPAALLLMTIHGTTALDYAGVPAEAYMMLRRRIQEHGICETSTNSQIDGYAEHGGEYVNVFHHSDYVRRQWGASFEILDILPGVIFTHDLVVMRKRAGAD